MEVYPFDPRPEMILLQDIAHALSMKCRFTGHTRFHYSVAQHSILMATLARTRKMSEEVQRYCLLHDATEAYLPDIASPLKRAFYVKDPNLPPWVYDEYRKREEQLKKCIYERFGLSRREPQVISVLDALMYRTEHAALMTTVPSFETDPPPHDAPFIFNVLPEHVRSSYLGWCQGLGVEVK
jgi:5'-deoxynucleotidase YfbR-like HD superfamily hydrolase